MSQHTATEKLALEVVAAADERDRIKAKLNDANLRVAQLDDDYRAAVETFNKLRSDFSAATSHGRELRS